MPRSKRRYGNAEGHRDFLKRARERREPAVPWVAERVEKNLKQTREAYERKREIGRSVGKRVPEPCVSSTVLLEDLRENEGRFPPFHDLNEKQQRALVHSALGKLRRSDRVERSLGVDRSGQERHCYWLKDK